MAKPKKYRVVAEVGVVGFKGVIHANGDTISSNEVPAANLNAWLRFGQIEEITEDQKSGGGDQNSEEPAAEESASESAADTAAATPKRKGRP